MQALGNLCKGAGGIKCGINTLQQRVNGALSGCGRKPLRMFELVKWKKGDLCFTVQMLKALHGQSGFVMEKLKSKVSEAI